MWLLFRSLEESNLQSRSALQQNSQKIQTSRQNERTPSRNHLKFQIFQPQHSNPLNFQKIQTTRQSGQTPTQNPLNSQTFLIHHHHPSNCQKILTLTPAREFLSRLVSHRRSRIYSKYHHDSDLTLNLYFLQINLSYSPGKMSLFSQTVQYPGRLNFLKPSLSHHLQLLQPSSTRSLIKFRPTHPPESISDQVTPSFRNFRQKYCRLH